MAEWLGIALQKRLREFDSRSRLIMKTSKGYLVDIDRHCVDWPGFKKFSTIEDARDFIFKNFPIAKPTEVDGYRWRLAKDESCDNEANAIECWDIGNDGYDFANIWEINVKV